MAAATFGIVLVGGLFAQTVLFATHDWNGVPGGTADRDTWSDVKTPGDFLVAGQYRTYSVGSAIASPPNPGSPFSGQPSLYPSCFRIASFPMCLIHVDTHRSMPYFDGW